MKNAKILYKELLDVKYPALDPVVYSELTPEKVRLIFKNNNGKSGVYRWNNLITGASYVGSSVDLTRRLRDYLSPKFLKKEIIKNNSIIYRALLKYGYSNFSLEILEYCDKMSTISKEQYYIDLLGPEYNICLKAGSSLGRVVRKETRLKLRNIWLNRLFIKSKDSTLREFIINFIDKQLDESRFRITKLYKEFWENTQEIKDKRSKIVSTIAKELDKSDPFGTGRGTKK